MFSNKAIIHKKSLLGTETEISKTTFIEKRKTLTIGAAVSINECSRQAKMERKLWQKNRDLASKQLGRESRPRRLLGF